MPDSYWSAIGYHCLENFALRIDVFERIFFLARKKIKSGPFLESSDLMNPVGCNSAQLKDILAFCRFDCVELGEGKKLFYLTPKKKISIKFENNKKTMKIKGNKKIKKIVEKKIKADPNSPFEVLEKLL